MNEWRRLAKGLLMVFSLNLDPILASPGFGLENGSLDFSPTDKSSVNLII